MPQMFDETPTIVSWRLEATQRVAEHIDRMALEEYAMPHPHDLTEIQRAIRGVVTLPIYLTPTGTPGEFRVHLSLPPGMGYDVVEQVLQEALHTVRRRQVPLMIPREILA